MKTDLTSQKPVVIVSGLASEFGPPIHMERPHSHDDIELNFLEEGSVTYLFGEKTVNVEAGQLTLFWATMPHQLVKSQEITKMYWLHLPLASYLQWQLPDPLNEQILNGKLLVDEQSEYSHHDQFLFKQWYRDLKQNSAVQPGIILLEIEARLRRMALNWNLKEATSLKKNGTVPSKVEQMALYITEHYAEPLKIEQIAQAVGLHPNYAMTIFRQAYGLTMNQFLIRYRVLHAQRLLATSELKVLDIALEAGFESLSTFYTAFESICEVTPRQYRAALF